MKLFSSIPNWVDTRGFLFGWEPALLGNCLSSLANLVAFSIRTGVPVYYPNIDDTSRLYSDPERSRALFDPKKKAEIAKFIDVGQHIKRLLTHGVYNYNATVATIRFEQLPAYHDAKQIVLMLPYVQEGLKDWREDNKEALAASFCLRGNGLIYPGCYWLQYMDMNEAAAFGPVLREHLGALRSDGCEERARFRRDTRGVQLGIHLRQGKDYRTWYDGRYFYSLDQYKDVMRAIHVSMGDTAYTFQICADTDLRGELFGDMPVFYRKATAMDDFLCLTQCDSVVGPPSTFATWAAFLGFAKRLVVTPDRVEGIRSISDPLSLAINIPFPTGSYLPGDPSAGPI